MHLKKLQLLGFKTFADKTEIEIGEGLTAVVGPNGSGKSNIVDALLWVLGEQNPRLMRGNTAQDVIFAGTDKRKPVGMAEVKLTVDNSDRTLPVDFGEVTVTRRIYRSGESQYLLNGAACRLKDIVELFLDTGVGKGAYAFVSQQEIDAVLSARPEDRRELFEEAAGIKKYRVKKREALKKLESAETNLNRVRDILHELEQQREPMEKQAMAARRYLLLQERLHEIEVGLLVAELQKADYELYSGRAEREADQSGLLQLDADLTMLERASTELGERLARAEAEWESARQVHQNSLSHVERTESRLSLLTERSRTAHQSREQLEQELADIKERIAQLKANLAEAQKDREQTETEEAAASGTWTTERKFLAELESDLRASLRQADAHRNDRLRLAQERARREAGLKAARDRLQDAAVRAERLAVEAADLVGQMQEAAERRLQHLQAREKRKQEQEDAAAHHAELNRKRQALLTDQSATKSRLDTARRKMAEQSSRFSTLKELQESHEGFYQGVRAVLNANRRGALPGHYRAVVDLLTVPEPYRIAVEVALGGSLQDIVTLTESEAKGGIEWLKQNRAGRATFLALPLLRSGQRVEPPAALMTQILQGQNKEPASDTEPGAGIYNAMDLVDFDPQYATAVQMLLGRTIVVQDMDIAIAVSRRLTGWSKIVTLEGELLSPGGALTGGSLQGRGTHLVGRKGEMDDLRAQLPELRVEVEKLITRTEAQQAEFEVLENERNELSRREATLASETASLENTLAALDREYARLQREQADRATAQTALSAQMTGLERDAAQLTEALQTGAAEDLSADDALAVLSDRSAQLSVQRDACRTRAVALEVEVGRLREKREGLNRAMHADRSALAALEQQFLQKSAQRARAAGEGEEAVEERARLDTELDAARTRLKEADEDARRIAAQRQALLAKSFTTNTATKDLTKKRSEVTANLHATELRMARLEVQVAQCCERLQEEYAISREEALARPDTTAVERGTAIEVGRLRRELRAMGQVNTGAVTEYERLTERFDFLTMQRADLQQSRESLLATIAEIDDSTRGVFMETFEAVRKEFDRLFSRLFEGGTTRLILTNPDDILETGIEVIAQPPGKKPQHLSLLSGGERALTATALLFAFLAVKPSPFVLLDEVDAPLDGANVEKFTHLVREFSERSQFLLITHNPTTMEAAPNWYGVTMREPGISSVLSYRVPQESTVSAAEQQVKLTAGAGVAV